jgi:acyl carrier protein
MAENIQETITQLLTDILLTSGISETPSQDMSLIDSGLLDSLNIVTFVGKLEKVFGISVSMSDMTMDNFDKIEFICELVKSKQLSR